MNIKFFFTSSLLPVLFAFIACASSLPARGYGLFYQPLAKDTSITAKQWNTMLELAVQQGASSLIIQWTRYQGYDFVKNGTLQNVLAAAEKHDLPYWIGLTLPVDYFSPHQGGIAFTAKFIEGLTLSNRQLATLQLLGFDDSALFRGWYLPVEISSEDLKKAHSQQRVTSAIEKFKQRTNAPLAISYYMAQKATTNLALEHINHLNKSIDHLWVQRGNGLNARPGFDELLPQLPCQIGVINELFIESKTSSGEFFASGKSRQPQEVLLKSCHPQLMFSLRYMADIDLPR